MQAKLFIAKKQETVAADAAHVRCTMYDVRLESSRALRGIRQSKCGRDFVKPCASVVRKRRGEAVAAR